jgi:hypothetical protein
MRASATDELLSELLAHAIVLRARAEQLTAVVLRPDVAATEVLASAAQVAGCASAVARVAAELAGNDGGLADCASHRVASGSAG